MGVEAFAGRAIAVLLGFGIGIDAVESIWLRSNAASPGLLHLERYPITRVRVGYALDAVQLICAMCIITQPWWVLTIIASLVLVIVRLFGRLTAHPGRDGADQMFVIVLVAISLFSILPSNTAKQVCLLFIGAQAILCYSVAGLSKLSSPAWRDGIAVSGILSTRIYGDRRLFQFLDGRPLLSRAIGWSVIAFECSVIPLVFAGVSGAILFVISGFVFHIGGAVVMRLYRFFWAMIATYPALIYLSDFMANRLSQHGIVTWQALAGGTLGLTLLGAAVIVASHPAKPRVARVARVGGNDG